LPADRQLDVHYEDLERDWRATLRRIYGFLGLELDPALPAMERYQRRCSKVKGPHQYSLEQFGLTAGQVLESMSSYVDTYDVAVASPRAARA
jgi:hypothetical protein